ncbi:MAG TPA: glycosyltransferase, partial [Gemmatimonadaceae bacterium]|nr:glycosyltransferase [Gemmatimonadaceae bacterium]
PLTVDVIGGPLDTPYAVRLRELAASDPRISFRGPVPHEALGDVLGVVDVLLVPSRALETGPLVILEALAVGVPVIGTPLGGIAELVEDDRTGKLLPDVGAAAWSQALAWLAGNPDALARWRGAIGPQRTMLDAARDMVTVYDAVVTRPLAARGRA